MQTNKRPTIGRTFTPSSLDSTENGKKNNHRFTLASGATALFKFEHIAADKVQSTTTVNFLVNGRDQAALTEESVSDIVRTIKLQQFFPAIGRRVGDKIDILDGSRRRAAAIFAGVGLDILVTDTDISAEDARQLAADIQTAREHNIREIGLRLIQLRESGMNQKEIAESNGMSQAKVTRAIQCASVHADIIMLFPVVAELSYPDYKALLDATAEVEKNRFTLSEVIDCVRDDLASLDKENLAQDEIKNTIIKLFKEYSSQKANAKEKPKQVVTQLWDFKDKDSFARKRVKDRAVSFEFNRVSKDFQDEVERMMNSLIRKHYGQQD